MLLKTIVYSLIFTICFADFDENLSFCKNLPGKPINGHIRRDRVSFYNGQGYIGTMNYMCSPGFDLIGKKSVVCENGIWTEMPKCIPKKRCLPIKSYPSNTILVSDNITLFQHDPQQIISGSSIELRCADNYELDPTTFGSLIIQCQTDGTWTPLPQCKYVQSMCDYSKLYLPAHSRINQMNFIYSEHNRQLHLAGSNLEYTCEDGYRLHDGKTSLIVECLSSGSWSEMPVCEYVYQIERTVRCNYPIYIRNGFMTLYNVTIWEDQTYTGRIVYECNYGFETDDGHDQIVSDCVNGSWTNIKHCREIPTCSKEELLEIESQVQNSYIHNVSLNYVRDPSAFVYNSYVLRTCLPNFEHDPSGPPLKIQCLSSIHTWTGVPICRATTTTTVPSTTSQFETTITEQQDTSSESDSLVFQTSSITIHMTTSSENDYDNDDDLLLSTSLTELETTPTVVCYSDEIPSIPNFVLNLTETNVTYDIGTNLFYSCQDNYESTANQTSFISCSSNGTWSLDSINLTMCLIAKNESTTTEQMIAISSNYTEESHHGHRQIREVVSYCKDFPLIEHTQLLIDETIKYNLDNETNYIGSATFVCQYGFSSDISENEPFRVTCRDGIFLPKVTCIEKPRCSLPPPIDTKRASVVDSVINVFDTSTEEALPGSYILLNCFDKTTDETTDFNMTCLESGQWKRPPPPCIAPYKRRCQMSITIPNARTQVFAKLTKDGFYDDGSRASYRCLEHFVHDPQSGPLHIQCRNGRWGPRPRCIPSGCVEPLPETIENGWKNGESYVLNGGMKYYLLTRYSCHGNAIMVDTSLRVVDIQCRKGKWERETLPECKLQE